MTSWRDKVINQFKYESVSLVLVHDMDLLLNDAIILHALAELGFDVVRYEDSISFRYMYETQYRQLDTPFKLIVYTNEDITFPYEYMKVATQIQLSIKEIFPKISARIVRELEISEYDVLEHIYPTYHGTDSDTDTLDFLVKYLYKIPYEIIRSEADLYAYLLSLHYEKRNLSPSIQKYLLSQWEKIPSLSELPLQGLLHSQTYFYKYIEKMWETFVMKLIDVQHGEEINESTIGHPLANNDVRRLMNDLFMEGAIKRVQTDKKLTLPDWIQLGIEQTEEKYDSEKQLYLREKIESNLRKNMQYKDWIEMVQLLSEYKVRSIPNNVIAEEQQKIFGKVNEYFVDWLQKDYHTLNSLPPYPNPKLVHHIPQVIQNKKKMNEKVALIVLDGMSFMQWRTIEKHLQTEDIAFEESGVFAWAPTLTSVSRQAIFSGLMPLQFAKTIGTTSSEESLWKSFWERHGVRKQDVTYQKSMGQEPYHPENIKGLTSSIAKVYGAVVDVIDQFSHNAVMGEHSVVAELNIWLESGYLANLLNDLVEAKYTVYITSDHGNTLATGIGRHHEGVLVEQRGERVRLYSDATLYEQAKSSIPGLSWSNAGLPEDYFALFSKYGEAYTVKGKQVITHGGISIEEVIVPFVKVTKNKGRG